MKKSRFLLASSLASTLILTASPAWAQEAAKAAPSAAETSDGEGEGSGDEIVVTGSLISNPNLQRSSPVNVTTADEIELKQSNVAEELLREIPGIVPNIGSAVNNGNNGSSFVDLRGLGPQRNIVLLDGSRVAPASLDGVFDLNNVPLALVDRIDVLTGSASTTYGADAVSGVINFITKNNFAGFDLTVSDQLTEKGDGNTIRADATIGANFEDGRGNVVLSLGYQQADPVFQGARSFSTTALLPTQAEDTTGSGSPTSTPARFAVPGLGSRQIDATGNLVAPFASFNFSPFNVFQTPFERFNIYAAGRYEISDAIEVYARGIFSKNSVDTIIAPSGIFNQPVTINLNNPFLPAGARATFCARNDFNAAVAGIQTLTVAQCNAAATATGRNDPNYREFTTNVRRRTTEAGPRISDYETFFFDYRLGLRGHITDTIRWDLSGSYGESENTQRLGGYVNVTRARQAALSDNGTTCQDPSGGCVPVNLFGIPGSISPASAAFLQTQSITAVRTSLAQVRGIISGDFGVISPFGSDPISFAVGGEYRKYKASQEADTLAQSPGVLGGSGGAVVPFNGGYDVYEAFGELNIPLIQDKPFFEDLSLETGVRYSSYSVDANNNPSYKTKTYKFGGSWTPIKDIKFRGNYSHAVRAPNINELFSPNSTGLTNLAFDPCQGAAPLANANLRAICLAQGAPAFTIGNIAPPAAGQVNNTTGGSVALRPETANTYTFGVVLQPSMAPGLSLSVDYYNIKVKKAITLPTPDDVIAACFGATPTTPSAAAATTLACTGIRRDPSTGGLDGDPATTFGLLGVLSNLGRLKTTGIDASLNYKRDIGFADLSFNFNANYTFDSQFQATPTSINRECVGYYSVSCTSIQPKFQFSQRTTLSFNKNIDVSLLWRHIDSEKYEPLSLQGEFTAADLANRDVNGVLLPVAAQGCPDFNGADPSGCVTDSAFRKIKSFNFFDFSTRFGVGDNLTLTMTVQNLFDKKPPITAQNIGATAYNSGNTYPSTYDALGRRFAMSAKLKF